jgi:hypothetical protein
MPRTISIEQHAVFVTLADHTKHRVSDWMDWDQAITRWTAMDDQRREALLAKGLLIVSRFPGEFEPIKHYEVRSENDPAYASLPEMALPRYFRVLSRSYTTEAAAAKAVLKPLGYYAKEGGWVYYSEVGGERTVAQGWWSAARTTGHPVVRIEGETGHRAMVSRALLTKVEKVQA